MYRYFKIYICIKNDIFNIKVYYFIYLIFKDCLNNQFSKAVICRNHR